MLGLFRLHGLPCLGLAIGFLALLTSEVKADLSVDNIGLYDGTSNAPTAWISFTGTNGGFVDVYADPQKAMNWTSNGSPIALYCIDTIHENAIGNTYNVNPEAPPTFSTSAAYTDAANRVAWALENGASTANARGATQLLVWAIIDKNFSVNWTATNHSGLQAAYNLLVSQMGSGYQSSTNYQSGVEFLKAVHDPTNTLYQDLAFAAPGLSTLTAVPEPSTLAIAGLAALGMIGYGLRRRTAIGA